MYLDGLDWKALSRGAVSRLHEDGLVFIPLGPLPPHVRGEGPWHVSAEGDPELLEGREQVTPKRVREFLWRNRNWETMGSLGAVMWIVGEGETGHFLMGLGRLLGDEGVALVRADGGHVITVQKDPEE